MEKTIEMFSIKKAVILLRSFIPVCKIWILLIVSIPAGLYAQNWSPEKNKQYIILSEQAQHRVAIADVATQKIVWEWRPAAQPDIKPAHADWFRNMSDAKPVNNGKYILACASGGGVALIRIADKKTVFYAYAGGNTHSAELLPDGNIVSASSTGNFMRLFTYNSNGYPENIKHKDYYLHDGHNLVWDKKRRILYTVADNQFKTYHYNNNKTAPDLVSADSTKMPDGGTHDLYWDFGKQFLWLTNNKGVYTIQIPSKKTEAIEAPVTSNIKSVSTGAKGYSTIVIQPKESWWTDEVLDINGKSIFKQQGLRIYKARWLL